MRRLLPHGNYSTVYFIIIGKRDFVKRKNAKKKNKICSPPKLLPPAGVTRRRRCKPPAIAANPHRTNMLRRRGKPCAAFRPMPRQTCAKNLPLPQSTHKRQARRSVCFLRFPQYPRQITPPAAPAGLSAQKSGSDQSPAAKKPRASKRRPISSSTASLSAEIVW